LTLDALSKPPALTVRRATPEDATVLAALRRPFWEDQISKGLLDVPPLDGESLLAASELILKRPRTSTHIAYVGTASAGFVYGQARIVPGIQRSIVAMIEELYVDSTHGSASAALALMRSVIADLRSFGATRIQAKVLYQNGLSRKFFEFSGFSPNLIYYEFNDAHR